MNLWKTPSDSIGLSLFNLRDDIGERQNLAKENPEIVEELKNMGVKFQSFIEENQRGVDWITEDDL